MADAPPTPGGLFGEPPPAPDDPVVVNGRCLIRVRDGHRIVLVAGVIVAHHALDDATAAAHAMVHLVAAGFATQVEVAAAFGCATRTVRRHQQRYEDGGLTALGHGPGYPSGRPRAAGSQSKRISALRAAGHSLREIAARVGVSEKAVRKTLRRLGWRPTPPSQGELPLDAAAADPNLSALDVGAAPGGAPRSADPGAVPAAQGADPNLSGSGPDSRLERAQKGVDPAVRSSSSSADPNLSASGTEQAPERASPDAVPGPAPPSPAADPNLSARDVDGGPLPRTWDRDPADRTGDRVLAQRGLLDDAAPLFRPGKRVPHAGVLLAVPGIVQSNALRCAREVYGSIGPAFYGLRTSILALILLALMRIKRPEALKEHSPEDLGRVLGLDRAPEVKTLRRKLARLAARADAFGRALAERRVQSHQDALGYLYTDGHVRVYHGARTLPKAHVARMRISAPATTDYWVHDARGEPLFVVTAEANAGLTKMLLPLLSEIRALVGERRVTIVFDRGGWSPTLFQQILEKGFDLLTYRKGKSRRVPRRLFSEHTAEIDGRTVSHVLADRGTHLLGGRLRLRQVTRLSDDGHQTPIITSRKDLPAIEVAYRMFARWREENFFKYLREEFALDALVDYAVEPADPERDVPNPRYNALTRQIAAARREATRLCADYGVDVIADPEQRRTTLRDFEAVHAAEALAIVQAFDRLEALEKRRKRVPRRVPVKEAVDGDVVQLATGRNHLMSVVRMVAYQVESELLDRVAPHYPRSADEGRTLLHAVFRSAADIDVAEDELRVTLAPLSSPHRSRAVAALCDALNTTPARFPGTPLTMRFAVAEGENRTG